MSYVIVRNPVPKFLPRFIRRWIDPPEEYLAVDVRPFFTRDFSQARLFPSYSWAAAYVRDAGGQARPGMGERIIIRFVRSPSTIP